MGHVPSNGPNCCAPQNLYDLGLWIFIQASSEQMGHQYLSWRVLLRASVSSSRPPVPISRSQQQRLGLRIYAKLVCGIERVDWVKLNESTRFRVRLRFSKRDVAGPGKHRCSGLVCGAPARPPWHLGSVVTQGCHASVSAI